ncbi:MAG TPA: hypothetical protein VNN17_08985 [Terriglobia bacterium]|nr:hypothetical protein [Terriglobia bacterium]
MAHPQIAAFARLAKGGEAPNRLIFGQPTNLSRTMHDIRYNEKRDEILVTNPFAQAVLIFRGDANGQVRPARIIQGPKTEFNAIDALAVDSFNDEIYVPDGVNIKVFPGGAHGDVAPIRTIRAGADMGWRPSRGIGIDYVHNVIATDGTLLGEAREKDPFRNPYGGGRDSIFILDRLADGKTKPLRIIRGDKTGIFGIRQMDIYPKGGWILVAQITDGGIAIPEGTFLGVWSIYDQGNVPPRWKIDGKASNILTKPRGVSYNPKHKEVLVADMRLNAVLTFSFPEIFDQVAQPPQ